MRVETRILVALVLGAGGLAAYLTWAASARHVTQGHDSTASVSAEATWTNPATSGSRRTRIGDREVVASPTDPHPAPLDPYTLDPRSFSSAEDLLRQYWGSRWAEVEKEIRAAGVDLSTIDVKQMNPWSVTRTTLQERLAQGVDQGSVFLGAEETATALSAQCSQILENAELPEADRVRLETHRKDFEQRLASVTSNLKSKLLELKLNAIDDPRHAILHPIVFPHKTVKTPRLYPSDFAICESVMTDGWTLLVLVRKEEVPGFDTWTRDIQDVLDREAAYLGSWAAVPSSDESVRR